MTNKEWMSTLPAEQFYNKMMCLIYDYGFRFNNARLAIIDWLDEPHEAEPIQNKTSNALKQENEELTDNHVGKWMHKEITASNASNALNALDCVEERKKGEWDMFDLISSAWYGKGMYFIQDNEMVYSRHSGKYMTFDEAIREFVSLIDEDELPNYVLRKKGKWMHKEITADFHAIGQCSVCKERRRLDNFCPNCGADMRGGNDE